MAHYRYHSAKAKVHEERNQVFIACDTLDNYLSEMLAATPTGILYHNSLCCRELASEDFGFELGLLTKFMAVAVTCAMVVTMTTAVWLAVTVVVAVAVAEAEATTAVATAAATPLLSSHSDVLSAANLAVNMTKKSISLVKRPHFHVRFILFHAAFCSC